jgi:hypothetical protein
MAYAFEGSNPSAPMQLLTADAAAIGMLPNVTECYVPTAPAGSATHRSNHTASQHLSLQM